jgi:hypothetical protein
VTWKKLITSGSSGEFEKIIISGPITASSIPDSIDGDLAHYLGVKNSGEFVKIDPSNVASPGDGNGDSSGGSSTATGVTQILLDEKVHIGVDAPVIHYVNGSAGLSHLSKSRSFLDEPTHYITTKYSDDDDWESPHTKAFVDALKDKTLNVGSVVRLINEGNDVSDHLVRNIVPSYDEDSDDTVKRKIYFTSLISKEFATNEEWFYDLTLSATKPTNYEQYQNWKYDGKAELYLLKPTFPGGGGTGTDTDGSPINLTNVTSDILPGTTATYDIGSSTKKFNDLFAVNTFFGGVHEINLETEGLDQMQEGTILSLKDGVLQPCEKESDSLVMGVVSKGRNYPIVLGAEPVLVTGKIKTGDYIITSKVKGHGKGVSPKHIYSKLLFGKVIAQAIEDGEGKSYTIKAMIRKM